MLTTTTILGELVSAVVGDEAVVEVILPIGADPHEFRPSSQDVARIHQADLVIANGFDLEAGLLPALAAARRDGIDIFEVAPLVDPLMNPGGAGDPHFWTDPLRLVDAAAVVATRLGELDGSVDWHTAADAYAANLETVHQKITEILSPIAPDSRKLITNHDSFDYFADRYGFEIVGTVFPSGSTLADPSSSQIADLVRTIETVGVSAIFAETVHPTRLAEAVAEASGREIAVVELYTDSLGPPGSGAESLLGMLLVDAERIAAALSQ